MRKTAIFCLALAAGLTAALTIATPASAGELAGVTLDDSVQVADQNLVLNGLGLRKKLFIKVYVAGLYLEAKNGDAGAILAADGPRRTVMQFVRHVSKDQLCGGWDEGLANNTPSAAADLKKDFATLCGYMEDLKEGDQLVFTYVPGTGTEVSAKGAVKGTIAGKAFADALFACWIGPSPPSEDFKAGLLGG